MELGARQASDAIQRDRSQAEAQMNATQRALDQLRLRPSPNVQTNNLDQLAEKTRVDLIAKRAVINPPSNDTPPPYAFKSPIGQFREDLESTYGLLYNAPHSGYKRNTARQIGLIALESADLEFYLANEEDAEAFKAIGKDMLDLTLGLDPVTGLGRSTFELLTGKNVVTGAKLNKFERSLSAVGVMTFGMGSTVIRSVKVASRMFHIYDGAHHLLTERRTLEYAIREGQVIYSRVQNLITETVRKNKITQIHTAEYVNETFFERYVRAGTPPFEGGSHVIEVTASRELSGFARVHAEDNMLKGWLVRRNSVEGLSASDIMSKYSITRPITHVSEVVLPKGTRLLRGNINGFSGPSGAIQYYIIDIQKEWFKTIRRLD